MGACEDLLRRIDSNVSSLTSDITQLKEGQTEIANIVLGIESFIVEENKIKFEKIAEIIEGLNLLIVDQETISNYLSNKINKNIVELSKATDSVGSMTKQLLKKGSIPKSIAQQISNNEAVSKEIAKLL